MCKTDTVAYRDEACELEGFVAYPEVLNQAQKRPLVILCHAWRGRDEFICEKARQIAELGYVGFALDMYGKSILGSSKEGNAALKKPFIEDRKMLQRRVLKAFEAASRLPYVDAEKIAVLGFGFGGICALDLARCGAALKGAISIYGHFDPPPFVFNLPIQAKILVLHGYDDPVASREEFQRFQQEMSASKVDWQSHLFGNTLHAFATPSAHDPAAGILYNPLSAARAWVATGQFLEEIFSL